MSTGLYRVYLRDSADHSWWFLAGFVHIDDAQRWIKSEQSGSCNEFEEYKIMYMGKKIK